MAPHQGPDQTVGRSLLRQTAKPCEIAGPIGIIYEKNPISLSPHHDLLRIFRQFNASRSGHRQNTIFLSLINSTVHSAPFRLRSGSAVILFRLEEAIKLNLTQLALIITVTESTGLHGVYNPTQKIDKTIPFFN